ncbi:hypothetical protein VTK73DRAFT_6069 [Phialemonium thermophilum]|uniref:Uncharacterized protein n=1 Tax=Phialemonium thermophilum TaxID=223376 RepID=A0ABR3V0Q5_9PEZI
MQAVHPIAMLYANNAAMYVVSGPREVAAEVPVSHRCWLFLAGVIRRRETKAAPPENDRHCRDVVLQ